MSWTFFTQKGFTKADLLARVRQSMGCRILQEKVTPQAVYFLLKPADKPSFIAVVLTEK